jgi:hypothetical protein
LSSGGGAALLPGRRRLNAQQRACRQSHNCGWNTGDLFRNRKARR